MKFSLFIVSLPNDTPIVSNHSHEEEKPAITDVSANPEVADNFTNPVTMKYLEETAVTPVEEPTVQAVPVEESKAVNEDKITSTKEITFEELLTGIMTQYKILNSSWLQDHHNKKTVITFTVQSGRLEEEIFELLIDHGVGTVENSSVNITPLTLAVEPNRKVGLPLQAVEEQPAEIGDESITQDFEVFGNEDEQEDIAVVSGWTDHFVKSIQARIIMRPVIEGLRRNAQFTFDYLMFIIIASVISTIGLIENSPVILVASMLISPLMGPILAKTFGAAILDKELALLGLQSTVFGLAICVVTGFIVSLPAVYIVPELSWITVWPTTEMFSRGATHNLIVGAVVAFFSGAGVALSVLGENTASLVGVAISASLLPPAVNTGLLWALSFSEFTRSMDNNINTTVITRNDIICPQISATFKDYIPCYTCNMSRETALLGLVSFTLTLINILCIIIGALIFLKIKEVAPNASNKDERQFWMELVTRSRKSDQHITTDIEDNAKPQKSNSAEVVRAKTTRQIENLASRIETNPTYMTVKNKYKPTQTPTKIIRDMITPKPSHRSVARRYKKQQQITLPTLADLGSDRFSMYRS